MITGSQILCIEFSISSIFNEASLASETEFSSNLKFLFKTWIINFTYFNFDFLFVTHELLNETVI